ncbi:cytoplasmic protein [Shewanella sp. TC10]|uniref:cytoplasmic protein n=1 Tax=Shewanella sp. TC10 TaxID=1419739 RepID=UPI00129DCA1C|nr:cytoplasmic protein [Shewanella sp. TC10]
MSLSINAPSSMPTNIDSATSLKVAAMSKDQQKVQGEMALQLIEAALPAEQAAPQPVGNTGHIISTKA